MGTKPKKEYEPPKAVPLSRAIGAGRCRPGGSTNDCFVGSPANTRCGTGSTAAADCSAGSSQP